MSAYLPLVAANSAAGQNWSSFAMIGQFFFYILVFALVIVLAYFSTKWIAGARFAKKGRNLRILESLPLGAQNSLQLVQAGDKVLLIGVTKESVTSLAEIPPESLETIQQPSAGGSFDQLFRKLLNRDGGKKDQP